MNEINVVIQLCKVYDVNYKHVDVQVFIILFLFPIFLINEFSREI